MTSVLADEDEARSAIARRLSILPATIGLVGVAIMVVGSAATGLVVENRGWSWVLFAASLVVATVVSGSAVGLYIGLAILSIGALTSGDELSLAELVSLAITVLVTHETVRFSLDARRPSRFGPGLVGSYVARTVGVAMLTAATVAVGWQFATADPPPPIWIPIGIVVAALPLFVPSLGDWLDARDLAAGPGVRAVLASVLSLVMLSLVVLAATARTAIESQPVDSTTPTATPTTTIVRVVVDTDPASIQRVLIFAALILVVLIVGVLYLALRRPEAVFELDDLDQGIEDVSFGIAVPERAKQEDEVIEVDDQDLAGLLRDIRLDIETEEDPGRAIRFGYATIERRLGELRLTREAAETEPEFLLRAMPQLGGGGRAMTSLTRLFEQARFDGEAADEAMRERAITAIGDLLNHLDVDKPADDSGELPPGDGPGVEQVDRR